MALVAGQDYPGSYAELRAWFDEDWKCLDYLDWLRWPQGFVCPRCAHLGGWRGADRRWRCAGCDRRVSATAGTIFDNTRTPLTIWFSVAWQMISSKSGVSAIHVQREMGLGSRDWPSSPTPAPPAYARFSSTTSSPGRALSPTAGSPIRPRHASSMSTS